MKKIGFIFLLFATILILYAVFLRLFPLKKNVFYTNDERAEEFIYTKETYPIVITGSSLSGVFENRKLFSQPYFNLYMPFTGACTGVEIIRQTNKIPRVLFVEINHIDRGIDTALVADCFNEPSYSLKHWFNFLQKKNQVFPNLVDRIKAPHNNIINSQRPPAVLYKSLLQTEQREWSKLPDQILFDKELHRLEQSLEQFSAKGCKIYFYEMPMDRSLYKSSLLTFQRNCIISFAAKNGYKIIRNDSAKIYNTGDGVHLLKDDSETYLKYFAGEVGKM